MNVDDIFGENVILCVWSDDFLMGVNHNNYRDKQWIDIFPIDIDWSRFRRFYYNGSGLCQCRLRDSMKVYHSKKREGPMAFILRMQNL